MPGAAGDFPGRARAFGDNSRSSTLPFRLMSTHFAPLKNDTFLRALLRQPTAYTPVWLMRQAGRYLAEYRATRERAGSFMGLAKNPDFATEVTLQPLERYPLDAAILFSDILTVPDAMGLGLHFIEGEGPRFAHPLRDEKAVLGLQPPPPGSLQYVFDAVAAIRRALDGRVPLIGFSGSPWTLACYMVEGGGSDDFHTVKTMLYDRPDLLHHLLRINAVAVTDYLNAQIDAGAQAVMMFDTWGGTLADGAFQQCSLHYMREVLARVMREKDGVPVPRIVFTKGGGLWLEQLAAAGADAVGLDWTVNLSAARRRLDDRVALQGNLDPAVLFAQSQRIRDEVQKVLAAYGPHTATSGHVFNLGHGISQFTPPEAVGVLVDAVHELSEPYHEQVRAAKA